MEISVIVPVYNTKPIYLRECVNSILHQTLKPHNYEIIIVDDGSTNPNTIRELHKLTKKSEHIRLIRNHENLGQNEARRIGFHHSRGKYITFVDSDDVITTDALETLFITQLETGADIIESRIARYNYYTKTYNILYNNSLSSCKGTKNIIYNFFKNMYSFSICGKLFKRSILSDYVFDMPLKIFHEDMTCLVRILFQANSVFCINKPIYFYRYNPSSTVTTLTEQHIKGMFLTFSDWINNAKKYNLLEKLYPLIQIRATNFIDFSIKRIVSLTKKENFEKIISCLYILFRKIEESSFLFKIDHEEHQGIMFLKTFFKEGHNHKDFRVFSTLRKKRELNVSNKHYNKNAKLEHGLKPSQMSCFLRGKIVFVCQADYHFRNAAMFSKELALRGYSCVILDNSHALNMGKRSTKDEDLQLLHNTEYIKINKLPYDTEWLSTALLVVVFHDLDKAFREALLFRNLLGLPTIAMIEGINDFLRVDFNRPSYLPYRRCKYVFLAGEDDRKFFNDRKTYIVGLPIIEKLAQKQPKFPNKKLAVLNVNFSYGVLEEHRDHFISSAKRAFEKAGWDWVITQHPMDNGDLSAFPVSPKTQYELIDCCTVFVSRFATGILEALASGKPVIYFNPHGEKVEKFKDPMGAYEIATNEDELIAALNKVSYDLKNGIDFRRRALKFLKRHTGYAPNGPNAAIRFANAVEKILKKETSFDNKYGMLFFKDLGSYSNKDDKIILDLSLIEPIVQLDETEFIFRFLNKKKGVMLDIDSSFSKGLLKFLANGWEVHVVRTNINELRELQQLKDYYHNLSTVKITSVSAFRQERTINISEFCSTQQIQQIDFLKIDFENFKILKEITMDFYSPEVILLEFKNKDVANSQYLLKDVEKTLQKLGYNIFVSQWLYREGIDSLPIWLRLVRYSQQLYRTPTNENIRENIIALKKDPGDSYLKKLAIQAIKFIEKPNTLKNIENLFNFSQTNSFNRIGFYGISGRFKQHYGLIKTVFKNREIFLFDSDRSKHGMKIDNLIINSPERIADLTPDIIIITSAFYDEIYGFLKTLKIMKGLSFKIANLQDFILTYLDPPELN